MVHQRQVEQQSYGAALSLDEESPLIPTTIKPLSTSVASNQSPKKCTIRKTICAKGPCLVIVMIASLTMLLFASFAMTKPYDGDDDDDGSFNMVQMLGLSRLPFMGRRYEMEQAQNLADRYRDVYLADRSDTAILYHELRDNTERDFSESPPEGCEGTVVILRHCDKGNIRDHCDYLGYERSAYLSTLFGDDHGERWPAPSFIFALNPAHRRNPQKQNLREIETVLPLANKFGLPVDAHYTTDTGKDLAEKIFGLLQQGEMCGKVAVIAWKHSDLPRLARKLGCGPRQGCPLDYPSYSFDEAWQIKFVYGIFPKRHGDRIPKHPKWAVFGNIQQEEFDPLAFSKQMGDYPDGGTPWGARWQQDVAEIPAE